MFVVLLSLTGCSTTARIEIEKNTIKETITATASNASEYQKIKNWNNSVLPLYYDQELDNPFGTPKKESGVRYYDVNTNNSARMVTATGQFNLNNHTKSSMVRGCFKYYNIIQNGNTAIFSTSNGLICRYTNFKIVVSTPYLVTANNATNVDTQNNIYTWVVSNSNKDTISVNLNIDFSKLYNDKKEDNPNDKKDTENSQSKASTIIWALGIILLLVLVIGYYLYQKKKEKDTIN